MEDDEKRRKVREILDDPELFELLMDEFEKDSREEIAEAASAADAIKDALDYEEFSSELYDEAYQRGYDDAMSDASKYSHTD